MHCAILIISALYVLLLLLLLFLGITFMEGVYNSHNTHLKQTMCLGYIRLQLCCVYSTRYMVHVMLIPMLDVLYLCTSPFRIREQCPIWLFSAVPSSRVFQVRWSSTFGMILRRFQSPLLLPASHALHFCCKMFIF